MLSTYSVFADVSLSLARLRQTPLVLYGAGRLSKTILEQLRGTGIQPCCFCDRDPDKQKSGHLGLPVLAAEQVGGYLHGQDFLVYLALGEPLRFAVQEELLQNKTFPQEQLVNYVPVGWYKSCDRIETNLFLRHDGLSCCPDYYPGVLDRFISPVSIDHDQTMADYRVARDLLRQQNQQADAPCGNCMCFQEKYWRLDSPIRAVGISHFIPCQMSCSYCSLGNTAHLLKTGDYQHYDGMALLDHLASHNNLAANLFISYGGGEISLNPEQDRIIRFMAQYGGENVFYSNCADHLPGLALLDPTVKETFAICPSLDCGTPETFQKIKGRKLFDSFVRSVAWYREHDVDVWLKYILTKDNSGQDDLDGFMKLCLQFHISRIVISANQYEHENQYQPYVVDGAFQLIRFAQKHGISYMVFDSYLGVENNRLLTERLEQEDPIQ